LSVFRTNINFSCLAAPALAQAPIPDARRAEFMIKTTLVALNHANVTGNYTAPRAWEGVKP
jgi:hypothetical protein